MSKYSGGWLGGCEPRIIEVIVKMGEGGFWSGGGRFDTKPSQVGEKRRKKKRGKNCVQSGI